MKKKPTFMEWLKATPRQKYTLIFQITFVLVMLFALLFNNSDMEVEWVIFLSVFLTSILWLCILRTYSIYTNLLRIDWFK